MTGFILHSITSRGVICGWKYMLVMGDSLIWSNISFTTRITYYGTDTMLIRKWFIYKSLISPMQNSEAMVSIDMPAGPSEVLVIADKHANPVHIAADLLSQVLTFAISFPILINTLLAFVSLITERSYKICFGML